MWLDLVLFCAVMGVLGWALDERNERIKAERDLRKEMATSETVGRLNGQLRARLEEAQARLVEVGGMGSPGPRSERRLRMD